MPERLVDVEKQGSRVLHTFPVTVSRPPEKEGAFKHKALEAAANAKLVPNEELDSLNAKMHVSRGGQLTPYGDPHGVLAETKAGLDQVVRERAYLLWEQAGRPEGRADEFWHQAQHERFCERAYALWEREGCPELWPKVGEGVNRGRRHIVGVFEPPLLHRRSDMPCPTITLSN